MDRLKTRILRCAAMLTLPFVPQAPLRAALTWANTEVSIDAPALAESVTAEFKFVNDGKETVTIEDVHSSCGCTVPEVAKRTYAPGESGTLNAVFTIGERNGAQEKHIMVRTTGGGDSTTALTLRVQIPKLYEAAPYFVVWTSGDPAEPKRIALRILAPDVVRLTTVESRHANFSAGLERDEGSPDTYSIVITPTTTEKITNGSIAVHLETTDGKDRSLNVYAMIRRGARTAIVPPTTTSAAAAP